MTNDTSNNNIAHALSGAGGGILSTVVTYPLITLSTRAQTEATRAKQEKSTANEPDVRKNTSALAAAKQIIQREGVTGLYSGLDSALFGIGVTNFVYYYFYEGTKALYKAEAMSTPQTMAAGALAGSATVAITNPIWVLNTRMTVQEGGGKKGTITTLRDIIQTDGIQALFSGIGPALVLVINPILQYTIFEQLKNAVERRSRSKLSAGGAFFLGAVGKIIATSVTYPYITLKSRQQLRKKDGEGGKNSNLIDGLRKIIAREGVAGLYKGITTKVLQSALTAAFLFFFKEQLFSLAIAVLGLLRRLRRK